MVTFGILAILLCRVVQAVFNKRTSNEIKNLSMLMGYSAYMNAISAILGLLLIIIASTGFAVDFKTVVISSFSGITLLFASACSIYAMKSGTISLNSMFATAGMIIPIIAGVFLFDSKVSPMQIVGIGIFFVSAWLLVGASKQIYKGFDVKTFLLLIGSMLANGGTMLAQQMFAEYVPHGNVSAFSFLSFGTIAVLNAIIWLIIKDKKAEKKQSAEKASVKSLALCGAMLAAAVFVINQFVTSLATRVAPAVLFAFVNGGGMAISAIVAAILYKEKLTTKTVIGLLFGVASLVIIKIFE